MSRRLAISSPILILALIVARPALASVAKLDILPDSGKVEFVAVGRPAMLRIHGEGRGPKGEAQVNGDQVTGDFDFALDTLNTGIDLRDEHMKQKYLQTAQYPTAHLKLTKMNLKNGTFDGELTLHGVTKPIHGQAEVTTGAVYKVRSSFDLNLSDFKVEIPSYMGIHVAQNVNLTIEFSARPE